MTTPNDGKKRDASAREALRVRLEGLPLAEVLPLSAQAARVTLGETDWFVFTREHGEIVQVEYYDASESPVAQIKLDGAEFDAAKRFIEALFHPPF